MIRFYLWLVALFNPLWLRLGVNIIQLRAILQAKLTMDNRRPNAYSQMRQKRKEKNTNSSSWGIILISLLMGIFYLFLFYVSKDHLMQLFIWFFVFMVMMVITLISDFTSVLIDVKDNFVILPKPVNDRTVVVSRLLHILIHISKIVLPIALPAIIFLLIRDGIIASLWFGILVLLMTGFGIFMVNAIYIIALRITTPERFREMINYVQIIFSVIVFATYYLAPRLLQQSQLEGVNLMEHAWLNLLPPFWFSGAWNAVVDGVYTTPMVSYIILVLLVPFISLWLVVKVFAPSFNRKLAMLSGGGAVEVQTAAKQASPVDHRAFYKRMAKLLTIGIQERLSFELVWLMTGRMRDFKLKVYPSIAYVGVYFVYFLIFNKSNSIAEAWRNLPGTQMYVLLIYISTFVFITAISNLVYSDRYKAAWVYYAAPLASPGALLMGAFKALLAKFFFPFYIIITAFVLSIWGPKTIPDLVLGFINVVLINLLFALIFLRKLPFSSQPNIKQSTGAFIRGFMILIIPGALGFGHYFAAGQYWLLGVFALLSCAAFYLVYMKYRETTWARLEV